MREMMDATKEIFREYIKEDVIEIMPCGNHDLNRNWVYKVTTDQQKYIIKLFYKPNKRIRELTVVPMLEAINPLRVIHTGEWTSGHEWIIYNHIEGWLLDHIIDEMDLDQRRYIFNKIGHMTALFHALNTFDHFGDWNFEKQSPVMDYKQFVISDCERMIENIKNQNLPDMDILNKAIEIVRAEYENIRNLKVARLCHRDLDGRNILIKVSASEGLKLEAFLDFEKTVMGNEYLDIIGFYRRYFMDEPKLIEHFFAGYESVLPIDESFNQELRFNLYRAGIDICSWALDVSDTFYYETVNYLKRLENYDDHLKTLYAKK
ncbi:MAG TPA: hypothetical protein DCS67_05490 [Clostridiales bacterium UBA8960]|jgi:Ser/Thr protein kinase RdoA (MazF antagonist)|nr:hypothetical protein [Clostridiales bacterium UBA8960]